MTVATGFFPVLQGGTGVRFCRFLQDSSLCSFGSSGVCCFSGFQKIRLWSFGVLGESWDLCIGSKVNDIYPCKSRPMDS